MFHLRRYWIVVCSVSLLFTGCGGKKSAEVIKAESHKSVALISHLKGHGVGFFIEGAAGVCTVLTAKHVVPDGKEISILTMTSKLPFPALDIRRADNADLAVVTFKPLDGNCPFPALKLGDSKDVVLKQEIYISSYPGGANGQAPIQSFYISNVTNKTPGDADGYEFGYKTDTLGGTSGSPVLNEFGEVIAVHGRSYMNKDSNPNDRAYLDLAIPINIYKQNQIFKIKELQTQGKTSIVEETSEIDWLRILQILVGIGTIVILAKIEPPNLKSTSETIKFVVGSMIWGTIASITVLPIPSIWLQSGIAKYNLGKKQEAIADYDLAIKIDPNYSYAYNYRGIAKYDLGKKQEAIADYDRAIKLNSKYYDAYYNRGSAKYDLDKKQEGIADYDLAIKLDPKDSAPYDYERGRVKSHLRKNKEEIAVCDWLIKIDPKDSAAYYKRGLAKSNLGKNEEAKVDYQESARLYLQQGKKKNYQKALDRIKELKI
jgi:Flp pilus assembly protein TadD